MFSQIYKRRLKNLVTLSALLLEKRCFKPFSGCKIVEGKSNTRVEKCCCMDSSKVLQEKKSTCPQRLRLV